MVHYGKHIIDPQTGYCEICDRGVINDLRKGKRTGKQFLYSNQDGKFTYRPMDEELNYYDEPSPRHARKPLYPAPAPSQPVRSRRAAYEEPVMAARRPIRRELTPSDESPRHHQRPTEFYQVDNEGQMNPRPEGPPEEVRRRYLILPHQSRDPRPNHVVRRRAQTPPPPVIESWTTKARRQHNSDSEIIERHHPAQPHHPLRKAEMYHLDASPTRALHPLSHSRTYVSHEDLTVSPRGVRRPEETRKRYQLEPLEKKTYREPEATVVKKIYRKVPPAREEPPADLYGTNGNHLRMARKVETIYPTPRPYESSPHPKNNFARAPPSNRYSTLYHLQPVDAY